MWEELEKIKGGDEIAKENRGGISLKVRKQWDTEIELEKQDIERGRIRGQIHWDMQTYSDLVIHSNFFQLIQKGDLIMIQTN